MGLDLRRGGDQADHGFRQIRSTVSVRRQGHEIA